MKIKILTTGGSIDKFYSTQESEFIVGPPQIENILADAGITLKYEIESLFQKDSLEISETERHDIVQKVRAESNNRILISHGTDTMIQTAQALVGIPGKVIVLTGAMQPAAFKQTDAHFNIGCALIAVQLLPTGVYLVMNGRVFDPDKTVKNISFDRFQEKEEES